MSFHGPDREGQDQFGTTTREDTFNQRVRRDLIDTKNHDHCDSKHNDRYRTRYEYLVYGIHFITHIISKDTHPIPISKNRKMIAPMSSNVICSRFPHHQTFWFSPTAYTDKSYNQHNRYNDCQCHNGIVYEILRLFLCCAYSCNRPYLRSFAYTLPTTLFRLKCPTSVIARLNPYFRLCRSAYAVCECHITFGKMYSFWIFYFLKVNTIFASHIQLLFCRKLVASLSKLVAS